MLARITREITATEDLQAVLSSIVTALVADLSPESESVRLDGFPAESLVPVPSRGFPYGESCPSPTEKTPGPKQFASVG